MTEDHLATVRPCLAPPCHSRSSLRPESYEAEADINRALAEGSPQEEAVDEGADRLEAEGEAIKDDLENQADDMDAAPQ